MKNAYVPGDELDGCEVDFTEDVTDDEAVAGFLGGEEEPLDAATAFSGGRDLGIADRLRSAGLVVKEVSGWKTRGDAVLNPHGAVTHHTAGAPRSAGVAPSLGIIINGRSDLSGPLANIYQDYEDNFYVVASGRANHAGIIDNGVISWAPDGVGNSFVWGLEVEHPGTFPLAAERAEKAARAQAAMVRGTAGADHVVYHKEWCPSRKIDLATAPSPAEHRRLVAAFLAGEPPTGDDEMKSWYLSTLRWYLLDRRDSTKPDGAPDGALGDEFFSLVSTCAEIHRRLGPPAVYQSWRDWKLLDGDPNTRPDSVPMEIPNDPLSRWWSGIAIDLAFANAFADKADDALQAELRDKTAQIAALMVELEAVHDDDARVVELTTELARVRGELQTLVESITP